MSPVATDMRDARGNMSDQGCVVERGMTMKNYESKKNIFILNAYDHEPVYI